MTAGKIWPSELKTYADPRSGVEVKQLTNYRAYSHHFYFTDVTQRDEQDAIRAKHQRPFAAIVTPRDAAQ